MVKETPEQQAERLRQFVLDFCDGKLFTDLDCGDARMVRSVFMVLALMDPKDLPEDAHIAYEHISKAGPMSINGMPTFFSCGFLTKAEWDRVKPAILAELERRKAVVV